MDLFYLVYFSIAWFLFGRWFGQLEQRNWNNDRAPAPPMRQRIVTNNKHFDPTEVYEATMFFIQCHEKFCLPFESYFMEARPVTNIKLQSDKYIISCTPADQAHLVYRDEHLNK